MRNYIFILLGSMLFSFSSNAQDFQYGGGVSLLLESPSSFGIQGKSIYSINDDWNAAGTFTYFLEDFTFWMLDLDAQYHVTDFGNDIGVYPLAGLNISRVNFKNDFGSFGDTSTGLNLGVSVQKKVNNLKIYLEPKIAINDGSALLISSGVLF